MTYRTSYHQLGGSCSGHQELIVALGTYDTAGILVDAGLSHSYAVEDAEVTLERPCVEVLNVADGLLERCNLAFVPAASVVWGEIMGELHRAARRLGRSACKRLASVGAIGHHPRDLFSGEPLGAWIEQNLDLLLSGIGASLSCCRVVRVPNVEMASVGLAVTVLGGAA